MNQILTEPLCRLSLDTRGVPTEERSMSIPYTGQTKFVFVLEDVPDIVRLRLKPLNESVVLKFVGFEVTTERNGIVALQPSESNASVILGEIFYFAVQDPQMVFDLSGLACGVVLSARADMEFLHKGRKAMEATVTALNDSHQELVRRLQAAEQRVMELEQEHRGLDELLLDTQYRIVQFEMSKTWRWTAPIRAMAKLITGLRS